MVDGDVLRGSALIERPTDAPTSSANYEAQSSGPHFTWLHEIPTSQSSLYPPGDSSYMDPLSNNGMIDFATAFEGENDATIGRLLALEPPISECEEIPVFHNVQSPVTIEASSYSADKEKLGNVSQEDCTSSASYFELPASLQGQYLRPGGNTHTEMDRSSPFARKGLSRMLTPFNCNPKEYTKPAHDFLNPSHLVGASPQQVRQIFRATRSNMVLCIRQYWEHYSCLLTGLEERIQKLIKDRGVKIKRRKRMGPEVPAIEKKEIRAQRNRERSQALRKHQKQRLLDLEGYGEQLKEYNSATKSLINCVMEDEGVLPLLQAYFTENECSETLLSFLSNKNEE